MRIEKDVHGMDANEIWASIFAILLAGFNTYMGIFAIPFVSTPRGAFLWLAIVLGLDFPLFTTLFFCISKKSLVYASWAIYVIVYVSDCLVHFSEKLFPLDTVGILKTLVVSVLNPDGIASIAVAFLSVYLYRAERKRGCQQPARSSK
ncbi:MAG TPA: hypothetical protein VGR47_01745 [Terracidiphilus sp.]|nr:hypothetical protein [Terracidiphilus sp.]